MAGGGGKAIRGHRIGAGASLEELRGEAAPRKQVVYLCSREHRTELTFALAAEVPETWDCPRCGVPSSPEGDAVPPAPRNEPYKTHLAYVKERRSEKDGAALLDEAVETLRQRRLAGELGT